MPPGPWPTHFIGQRFGHLVLIAVAPSNRKHRRALCRCDCGAAFVAKLAYLKSGHTSSCGCHRFDGLRAHDNTTHGLTRTPEHRAWSSMKYRCDTPTCASFPDYGGRGIHVCEPWRNSFECFLADIGPRPSPKHSIDRIDNDGHYEPGNVRWSTAKQQNANTRSVQFLTYDGETLPLNIWATRKGLHQATLHRRINHLGWSVDRALTTSPTNYHHR